MKQYVALARVSSREQEREGFSLDERLGPVVAYRLVKQHQAKVSLNLLWAMAAGLEGKDWRVLTEATKNRLRKEAEE